MPTRFKLKKQKFVDMYFIVTLKNKEEKENWKKKKGKKLKKKLKRNNTQREITDLDTNDNRDRGNINDLRDSQREITRVDKRGWGNFPWRSFSWVKKLFMKGAQDFLALFKKEKQWKNKYEKVFSTESKEKH